MQLWAAFTCLHTILMCFVSLQTGTSSQNLNSTFQIAMPKPPDLDTTSMAFVQFGDGCGYNPCSGQPTSHEIQVEANLRALHDGDAPAIQPLAGVRVALKNHGQVVADATTDTSGAAPVFKS